MTFSFDSAGFRRAIDSEVSAGLKRYAADLQAALDDVLARMQGRPLDEVRADLAATWRRVADGDITDPELTEWSKQLAGGGRIVLDATDFRV